MTVAGQEPTLSLSPEQIYIYIYIFHILEVACPRCMLIYFSIVDCSVLPSQDTGIYDLDAR